MEPLRWYEGRFFLIDQRALPREEREIEILTVDELCTAISSLAVRGAPAIGLAGAYGCVLATREAGSSTSRLTALCHRIRDARPTAVNLAWAVGQILAELVRLQPGQREQQALEMAHALKKTEAEACSAMARTGASLIKDGGRYLTHCNAGPLATGGAGTALGVFLEAHRQGKRFEVLVDETRPLLQGARLTAYELNRAGIHIRLITDSMAAWAMKQLSVDAVFVGADRIAANGDSANKIGSYGLALAAREHDVAFHVVAPLSTMDAACPDGSGIPIEERAAHEVLGFQEMSWAPEGVEVWNPAFDVIPASWITSIITEQGSLEPPFKGAIQGS